MPTSADDRMVGSEDGGHTRSCPRQDDDKTDFQEHRRRIHCFSTRTLVSKIPRNMIPLLAIGCSLVDQTGSADLTSVVLMSLTDLV